MADHSPGYPDPFDRLIGSLHGLPGVLSTKSTTLRVVTPLVGNSTTYIVQTYRQRDERTDDEPSRGYDTIFLEIVTGEKTTRVVLPSAVADTIARQRASLTDRGRSKSAKAAAAERKAQGIVPFAKKAKNK